MSIMLFVASSRMTVRKQREAVGLRDPPLEVTLAVLSEGTEVAGRGKKPKESRKKCWKQTSQGQRKFT